MIAALASIRAHAPLLTLAYALVWARALEASGEWLLGLLIAGAHTALVWLWFVGSARAESERGLGSRFGLTRELEGAPVDPLSWTALLLVLITGALCLALLAASWRVGLGFIAAAALLHWHANAAPSLKYRAIELIAPGVALVLPGLILAANLDPESGVDGSRVLAVSVLGGVALGAFLLACQTRDALRDAALDVPTTGAHLGPQGAGALAWGWMLAVMALAVIGAGWDWWHWSAGVIAGAGAAGASWGLAQGRADHACTLWYVSAVALSVAVGATAISPA